MKLLVIGGGGREAAIIKTLFRTSKQSIEKIHCIPGNAGIAAIPNVICSPISATNIEAIVEYSKAQNIDFAIVAQDDPLALGAVDALESIGIPCFGPNMAAARIESSKSFAKELMKSYNIPTAEYEKFTNCEKAVEYIKTCPTPIVIKTDGLAAGKGVVITSDRDEAAKSVRSIMNDKIFGKSGEQIIIEQYLCGPEVSLLCFSDGNTVIPMLSSMDHKRIFDFDRGPNTGGMGTIAPNPLFTEEIASRTMSEIIYPIIKAMKECGCPFKGCLFAGLMITEQGVKIIEFNARFGDPETQVVLPLLKGDLLKIMIACQNGTLNKVKNEVSFENKSACCVILASEGYPGEYKTGYAITLPPDSEKVITFPAGIKREGDTLLTCGGRVVGITAIENTLKEAIESAYKACDNVYFENKYNRTDIGKSALNII